MFLAYCWVVLALLQVAPPTAVDFTLVKIAGGRFTMGCTSEQGDACYDDERPTRQLTLADFELGSTEVTQAQWRTVMGGDPPQRAFPGCDQCPVESVSWDDVQEFLRRLNAQTGGGYRLPTEAEWEYAARGGQKSQGYRYAGSNDLATVAWYADNAGDRLHPVGQKAPNELGLYDLSGNVWEWCQDAYAPHAAAAASTSAGRVTRGGGWYSTPRHCRATQRGYSAPHTRDLAVGLRLAR